jgi:hypothetical protein
VKFVAEVLEVFRTDLELQNFLDHRRKVRQGPNRPERRRIGRPRRTSRCGKDQRVLNRWQRHAAII